MTIATKSRTVHITGFQEVLQSMVMEVYNKGGKVISHALVGEKSYILISIIAEMP